MLKNLYFLILITIASLSFSCKREIQLEAGESILYKQTFSGNKNIPNETLESIIPISQKPVNRPLNLPITPNVWWLNIGLNTFDSLKHLTKLNRFNKLVLEAEEAPQNSKTYRKIAKYKSKISRLEENLLVNSSWFWRTIGDFPSIINSNDIESTAFKIRKFYFDSGFRDATVSYRSEALKSDHQKIKLEYLIEEGQPYIIDSVLYDIEDKGLEKLILSSKDKTIVKKGYNFNERLVSAEINRIEILAKNAGYYNFSNRYIRYGAINDEGSIQKFKEDKKGTLLIKILNPNETQSHKNYKIEEVVFKAIKSDLLLRNRVSDTLSLNNITYITNDLSIPFLTIDKRIKCRPFELYKITNIAETQRQLGLLNQFAFVSQEVVILSDSTLRIEFFAPTLNKYSLSSTPGIQYLYNGNSSNFTGFIFPLSFSIRNSLKRFEFIEFSASGGVEGQPSPINATQIRGSLELGTNASISFPFLLIPYFNNISMSSKNPKTYFGGGFNYSEPFWGKRLNFNLKSTFSWQPNNFKQVSFSILDVNLINTLYNSTSDLGIAGNSFYSELVRQQELGNNLKVTFDPQFVSSLNFSFLYNNQNPQIRYNNATYLRFFAESGGTSLNFSENKSRIKFIENIFPLNQQNNSPDSIRAYFQFLKVNIDFRKYIKINSISGWAYRVNIGVINPYGKNKSVPYNKNFFIGGSNSVRAWSPLSLGVGSSLPNVTADGNIIPQPGDIMLESSIEYRATIGNFFGDIQFAAFLDAGNIWKWNQIPTKIDKANFDINRFYKEIALGTGFGLRYDLTYFLFRFDWGIKVIDPSRPSGERFVLDNFSLKRNQPYGLQLQFGIGYPF